MLITTDRHYTHTHRRTRRPWEPTQGSVAPANTLEKQNRQPVEPLTFQSAFNTEDKVRGEKWSSAGRKLPQPDPQPTDRRETQQAGRPHLLRGPRGGRRSLLPEPGRPRARGRAPLLSPDSAAFTEITAAAPPGRPSLPRPPRSDVRRLGAGYLWPG